VKSCSSLIVGESFAAAGSDATAATLAVPMSNERRLIAGEIPTDMVPTADIVSSIIDASH
jgi:hypothetical protein